MNHITRQINLLKHHLYLFTSNIRTYLVCTLLYLLIRELLSPISGFSQYVQHKPTPFAYVFICNDSIGALILTLGAIALFSSTPFFSKMHGYLLFRTSHKAWNLSLVIYIFIVSGVYVFFCVISSIASFIGSSGITFSTNWGKVWQTLAQTNARYDFEIKIGISEYITAKYTPLRAMVITMFLQYFFVSFIGMISYIGNSIHLNLGTILSAAVSLLDITITNLLPYLWYHISPLSLSRLDVLVGNSVNKAPSLVYAVLFLPILCLALSLYIVYSKTNMQR